MRSVFVKEHETLLIQFVNYGMIILREAVVGKLETDEKTVALGIILVIIGIINSVVIVCADFISGTVIQKIEEPILNSGSA